MIELDYVVTRRDTNLKGLIHGRRKGMEMTLCSAYSNYHEECDRKEITCGKCLKKLASLEKDMRKIEERKQKELAVLLKN